MEASLSSTLSTDKLSTHFFQPKGSSGYKSFRIVSCWNTPNQSGERRSINFQRLLTTESRNASVEEIKRAYRKMALQCHPDVCDISIKEESTKMLVELQEACRNLLNQPLQSDYGRGIDLEENQRAEWHSKNQWESQLFELNTRSQNRRFQKDDNWGCRMRATT